MSIEEQKLGDESVREMREILSGSQYDSVSQGTLVRFVPERVYQIAANKENVEVRQLRNEKGKISILIVEKEYPEQLTDASAYQNWQQEIEKVKLEQKDKRMKILPSAPTGVDRLHAEFSSEINKGKISFSDRILMTCKLRTHQNNQEALYVGDFDTESHKGIGQDFYQNTLPDICRQLGLRFIVGQNNAQNFSFFSETLGRYVISDLKPEFQNELFGREAGNNPFFTIQFLHPEDVEKYVKEDRIKH